MKHIDHNTKLNYSLLLKSKGNATLYIILLSLFTLFLSNSVYATLLLDSNWETGEYGSFGWSTSGNTTTTIGGDPDPVCSGNKAAKFVLNFSDPVSYRSQLTLNKGSIKELKVGNKYWIAFSVFLPTSYTPDIAEESVFDIHGRPDLAIGEGYRNAVLSIRLLRDEWLYFFAKDSKVNTGPPGSLQYEQRIQKPIGVYETGKWTNFVIELKLSYDASGYFKIWKNGTLVASRTGGIGYNDTRGPYFKIGIYKRTWDLTRSWGKATDVSSRKLFIDNFRVGDGASSYAEVDSKCIIQIPTGLSFQ